MRKWVAGVAFALAVALFATAGWHRFEYRYCNAQRLNLELASSGNAAQLRQLLEEDRAREAQEFRQLMLGGLFLLVSMGLWTGRAYPERFRERIHAFWLQHGPGTLPHN